MRVKLSNIDASQYDVRDEVDEEHVEEIAQSFQEDGQWNPIIVRPSRNGNEDYELIAGHTRCRAAEKIGWDELEATVKDVEDEEAKRLALKTNLTRKGMSKLEEGKVINDLLREHDLTQTELAERLGKSDNWVSSRIKVALELDPRVKGLVQDGEISYSLARIITTVPDDKQVDFAELLIEDDVTTPTEANEYKKRFLNDTIYTIGYEGREFSEFVEVLKERGIDVLIDVRGSTESTYKPEFNGDVLAERLEEEGIRYRHESEFGVHRLIRGAYKSGAISDQCARNWYEWYVREEADIDIDKFADELVREGVPALMCIERYAEPSGEQEIYCHRHFVADMIQDITVSGRTLFPNRTDL